MSYNTSKSTAKNIKEESKGDQAVSKEDLNPEKLKLIPFEILPNKEGPTKKQDYLFKMIIIGNSGVGKSCLMHRVTTNEFSDDHEVTVGVEFGSLLIKMEETVLKL
jgi:putative ribosome biogenesis GTPase RsgA